MKKLAKKTMPVLLAGLTLFGAAQTAGAASPADYGSRFMKQGMNGNDIAKVQQDLKRLNYFKTNVTGYYGPITKQAVLDFQRSQGVIDTGNVGDLTKNALAKEITKIEGSSASTNSNASFGNGLLREGTRSSEVLNLQEALKKLNYFHVNSTSYFGAITKNSVMNFQRDKGLVVDGIVGPKTKEALVAALGGTPSYTASAPAPTPAPAPAPSAPVQNVSSDKASAIIATAKKYLGVPYVWGGTSPSGFDCSGFVYYVLRQHGITNLPRVSYQMFNHGTPVEKSQLRAGDLVYFKDTYRAGVSHLGIYIGNGQFIQANSGAGKVTISDLNGSYYVKHYAGAKRVF